MRTLTQFILLTALLLAFAGMAMGAAVTVTLNTTALAGSTNFVTFQLNDGDGVANNSALLHGFDFGAGNVVGGTDSCFGDCSGTLFGNVALDDGSGFSGFSQQFVAGNLLKFTLVLSKNFA